MKKLRIFAGIMALAGMLLWQPVQAQTLSKKEKRQVEKLRREKEKTRQRKEAHAYYLQLLQKKYFVFQADYLTDTRGNSFILTPTINFMSVVGDTVVLQFGFDDVVGWNGVGGITVRGSLYHYKLQEEKKGGGINVRTDVQLIGPGLPPHLDLYVSDDGAAQLTIVTGQGDQITLFGTIVSPEDANIFKGMPLF